MLYFDHAASTAINEAGKLTLIDSISRDFANPSSGHRLGRELLQRIEKSRASFISLLGASDFNFIFTSSATESNNTIIRGLKLSPGSKVLYSTADHPSLYQVAQTLPDIQLIEIPLDRQGQVDYLKLSGLIDSNVSLLILSQVNNHSGNSQDIDRVGAILKGKAPKAHLHVDGVQAFGKIPFTLHRSHLDSYTISGHKIGAMKGISGFYLRKGVSISPLLMGGGQEMELRSSTLAAPLILSFAATAEDVLSRIEEKMQYISLQVQRVKEELQAAIPSLIFPFAPCSPYILTVVIPGLASDIMMRQLERQEVYVSSSSACSSKIKGYNPVYQALGLEEKYHKSVLRISFSWTQNEKEIDALIAHFIAAYNGLAHLIKG